MQVYGQNYFLFVAIGLWCTQTKSMAVEAAMLWKLFKGEFYNNYVNTESFAWGMIVQKLATLL